MQTLPQPLTLPQQQHEGGDVEAFKRIVTRILKSRLAKDPQHATAYDRFLCTAYAVSEHLVDRWVTTQETYHRENPKRVYYLSMEFLLGRSLDTSLLNLGLYDTCKQALADLGVDLDEILEEEADPGLGNGGLGRLAACFLDSHGHAGHPRTRLRHSLRLRAVPSENRGWPAGGGAGPLAGACPIPWEVARPESRLPVRFGGRTSGTPVPTAVCTSLLAGHRSRAGHAV